MSTVNNDSNSFPISVNSSSIVSGSTCKWQLQLTSGWRARNKKIALVRMQMYNAIPNIDPVMYNNAQFSYTVQTTGGTLTRTVNLIPTGTSTATYMAISDINNVLQQVMFSNGDYILDTNGNPYYFMSIGAITYADRFVIQYNYFPVSTGAGLGDFAAGSAYASFTVPTTSTWYNSGTYSFPTTEGYSPQFIIPASTATGAGISTILGFANGTSYPASNSASGINTHNNINLVSIPCVTIPQITPVTSLILQCDWVGNTQFNTVPQRIASIPINATYNNYITFNPNILLFYKILDQNYFYMNLTLCGPTGIPLTNLVENYTCIFDFLVQDDPNESSAPAINDSNKRLRMIV